MKKTKLTIRLTMMCPYRTKEEGKRAKDQRTAKTKRNDASKRWTSTHLPLTLHTLFRLSVLLPSGSARSTRQTKASALPLSLSIFPPIIPHTPSLRLVSFTRSRDSPLTVPTDSLPFEIHHHLLPVVQILERDLVVDARILASRRPPRSRSSVVVMVATAAAAEHGGKDVFGGGACGEQKEGIGWVSGGNDARREKEGGKGYEP